ncbi:MAG: hypothetical protein ACOC8Y_05020 [Candidatus Natronoplasma sp.]
MDKDELIRSAKKIEEPSRNAVEEFKETKEKLAIELNKRMKKRENLEELIGSNNESMMEDNSQNMVKFLHSVFKNFEAKVFVDTILWVFKTYRSHGFRPEYWKTNLNTFVEIMKEELSEETFDELKPFLGWMIEHIPVFVKLTDRYQEEWYHR